MVFIPGLGAVSGIGPGVFFPPWEPARRSHPLIATPTQCPACHHRDADSGPRSAQRRPPASTPQTDHRPFARDHRLRGATPATDSPSTRRAASHRATCDRWRGGAHLGHATAAPGQEVQVRSKAPRALGVVLTWPHTISSFGLQTRSKLGKIEADPLRGRFATMVEGNPCVVEYEPDADLRDTEQVPLLEKGGVDAFF